MKRILAVALVSTLLPTLSFSKHIPPTPKVKIKVLDHTGSIEDRKREWPGFHHMAVRIRISHDLEKPISMSCWRFRLMDEDGSLFWPSSWQAQGPGIASMRLAPGVKIEGWISFQIPVGTDIDDCTIHYDGDLYKSEWVKI